MPAQCWCDPRLRSCVRMALDAVIFLVWAFLPEEQLLNLGVSYYPSK